MLGSHKDVIPCRDRRQNHRNPTHCARAQHVNNNTHQDSLMAHKILIDYNKKGWARDNESRIREDYPEIHYVDKIPSLSASSHDSVIALFCITNGYDLLTSDKRAYASLLQNRSVNAIQISIYDTDEKSGQQVYLVKTI